MSKIRYVLIMKCYSTIKKIKLNVHKSEAFINYGETYMIPSRNFTRQSFERVFHMDTNE